MGGDGGDEDYGSRLVLVALVTEMGDGELGGADRVREVDFEGWVGVRFGAGFLEMPEVGPGLFVDLLV